MGVTLGREGNRSTDNWITPKWLLDRLGPFDLDPCACDPQPWPAAARQYTRAQDGLSLPWSGLVYCNPPYSRPYLTEWMRRMAEYDHGVALIFARTETLLFHDYVWPCASALLFFRGRLRFYRPDGNVGEDNSGGPSVLIAYGTEAAARVGALSDLGHVVTLK
jgi:hypothetical protein